jgi:hypothetical protein
MEAAASGALTTPLPRSVTVASRSGFANLLMIGLGPCLAALVRHRGFAWPTERLRATLARVQARDKCTRVVTAADEAVIRTPLKELLAMLDADRFWQVHRSVIVKVSAIRSFVRTSDDRYELVLAGSSERLPVSPAFKDRFRGM